tara:strand:+ start:157 stop:462 length:306 start_codon:yes stop_codon:yes gene_type:complete
MKYLLAAPVPFWCSLHWQQVLPWHTRHTGSTDSTRQADTGIVTAMMMEYATPILIHTMVRMLVTMVDGSCMVYTQGHILSMKIIGILVGILVQSGKFTFTN